MINGNVNEFVDHIHYGDELWFIYNNKKYFLEGWVDDEVLELLLYEMNDYGKEYCWKGDKYHYPVSSFLNAPIFDGKSFWEVETNIIWIDC